MCSSDLGGKVDYQHKDWDGETLTGAQLIARMKVTQVCNQMNAERKKGGKVGPRPPKVKLGQPNCVAGDEGCKVIFTMGQHEGEFGLCSFLDGSVNRDLACGYITILEDILLSPDPDPNNSNDNIMSRAILGFIHMRAKRFESNDGRTMVVKYNGEDGILMTQARAPPPLARAMAMVMTPLEYIGKSNRMTLGRLPNVPKK